MDIKVLTLILAAVYSVNAQLYNAAVLEYSPEVDASLTDEANVLRNAQRYVEFIAQAASNNMNIIVFPEYGMTTTALPSNLTSVSTLVPAASDGIVPCDNSTYTKFFVELSCAARTHNLHVVINLVERDDRNSSIFYNTNVVFNGTGHVIAKYRKINLFNEQQFTPGVDVVTFTAFDVTFGLFTCFDILFQKPAQEVLVNATDIIYPTAWTSETPFLQALSIQDGYAKAAGVNLLASGYSNVSNGIAGAGIFLANSSIADLSISAANVQNIFFASVTSTLTRTPDAVCSNNINPSPRIGQLPDISTALNVLQEDMANYTFQSLEINVTSIYSNICSEGSDFCCNYFIEFNTPLTTSSTVYKMVAFHGTRGFQYAKATTNTIGVKTCALVACASEDTSTCGRFTGNSNVSFRTITISTTLNNNNTFYQPSTLDNNHRPLTNYAFCRNSEGDVLNVTMSISNPQSVFAFGIFGRGYHSDGQPEGRGAAGSLQSNGVIVAGIISVYFCLKFLH